MEMPPDGPIFRHTQGNQVSERTRQQAESANIDRPGQHIARREVISNVPATILLLQKVPPGDVLAWAVNIGGFGLLPGSLANLIAQSG